MYAIRSYYVQRRLTRFGRVIAIAVIALCAILFGVGVLRGEDLGHLVRVDRPAPLHVHAGGAHAEGVARNNFV